MLKLKSIKIQILRDKGLISFSCMIIEISFYLLTVISELFLLKCIEVIRSADIYTSNHYWIEVLGLPR